MRFQKLLSYFKERPSLTILCVLLLIINIASLKPQFYFLGWDNYSSYFNLKTNLFRTLFATWREYRGLGVPSDSEVVDIFRQIFFLLLSPFLGKELLGQVYVLLCLDIGVLGMYFFVHKFFQTILEKNRQNLDFVSSIASFFYLFNLDTLATFYFPMVMYINRFASLPILFFIFLKLTKEKNLSLKTIILTLLAIFFITGSYLTATIFLTILLFLPIYSLFLGNYKRQFLIYSLFIGLNLFWLLPFINYTWQKSKIIRLAPTFIEANETQLNKPTSFYRLDKLLLLYPNFFETKLTDIATNQPHFLYPKTDFFHRFPVKAILFIFPILYFSGILLILLKYRKKELFWVPIIIFLSLFLVGKEYTPLGFFYNFLDSLTPYFGVLFRFADTKFNIFISFVGSLAASLIFLYLFEKPKKTIKILSFVPLLLTIFVFHSYLQGNLIGFFMYNKIPRAYFEIAEIINKNKENFRVLHLPFDKNGYWKSYVWGNISSSFIHFLIDKPFIDRTFEPSSMENASSHKTIFQLIDNSQNLTNQEELDQRSKQFYLLLKKTGTKYLIWDETVTASVYPRGANFWGKFNTADAKKLITNLKKLGLLKTIYQNQINIFDYLNIYPKEYPLDQKTLDYLTKNPNFSLELLQLKDSDPKIYFVQKAESADPELDNLLQTDPAYQNSNFIQEGNKQNQIIFPFKRENAKLTNNQNELILTFKNPFKTSGNFSIETGENNSEENRLYLEIFARVDEENLILTFYHLPFPIIQGQKLTEKLREISIPLSTINQDFLKTTDNLENYLSDWQILENKKIGDLKLKINQLVIPLSSDLDSKDKSLATVLVSQGKIDLELLARQESLNLNLSDFQLTDDPNCFKDKLGNYDFRIKKDNQLVLYSKNGSTCLWHNLQKEIEENSSHLELKLDLESKSVDLDASYLQNLKNSSKPILKNMILQNPKPSLLRICLKRSQIDNCFNKHQVFNLERRQTIIIPAEKSTKEINDLVILLAAKNVLFQEQEIKINSLVLEKFNSIYSTNLEINPSKTTASIYLDKDKDTTLAIPKALSPYSFFYQSEKDGFDLSNTPCSEDNSYRTFRMIDNRLVSYFENCSNVISILNNFDSNNFYLWNVDYHLFSGKYPKFILDDGFHHYKDEYLSLHQGYPEIAGFKILQKPEGILNKINQASYQNFLKETFQEAKFESAYTYINSHPELKDKKIKNFTLHHDSENEGIMSLAAFNIVELPQSWENLQIKTEKTTYEYDLPQKAEYQQILPSLWQVKLSEVTPQQANFLRGGSDSIGHSSDGGERRISPLLLVFNEGYDPQWQLLGVKNPVHFKFNGYANAWEINSDVILSEAKDLATRQPAGSVKTLYLFYAPESLSLIGWIATFFTVLIFVKVFVKKSPAS